MWYNRRCFQSETPLELLTLIFFNLINSISFLIITRPSCSAPSKTMLSFPICYLQSVLLAYNSLLGVDYLSNCRAPRKDGISEQNRISEKTAKNYFELVMKQGE